MKPTSRNALPIVSIGMPVYNGENYISLALDSLLSQSFVNFEIIISDNASEDKTVEIIKDYAARDSRIKYVLQEKNIGAPANYKFVLDKAIGEFFMWAAHDDAWDTNWIEVLINEIQDDDIGVRGSIRFLCDDRIEIRHLHDYKKGAQLSCFFGNENNYRCHYVYSIFRRSLLSACDFSALTKDYSPDNLFIFSLLRYGNFRSTINTSMTFRIHRGNLGSQYSKKWAGIRKIIYRIYPLRYYIYHINYIDSSTKIIAFIFLAPVKHIYAQISFWLRGARELITGKRYI